MSLQAEVTLETSSVQKFTQFSHHSNDTRCPCWIIVPPPPTHTHTPHHQHAAIFLFLEHQHKNQSSSAGRKKARSSTALHSHQQPWVFQLCFWQNHASAIATLFFSCCSLFLCVQPILNKQRTRDVFLQTYRHSQDNDSKYCRSTTYQHKKIF